MCCNSPALDSDSECVEITTNTSFGGSQRPGFTSLHLAQEDAEVETLPGTSVVVHDKQGVELDVCQSASAAFLRMESVERSARPAFCVGATLPSRHQPAAAACSITTGARTMVTASTRLSAQPIHFIAIAAASAVLAFSSVSPAMCVVLLCLGSSFRDDAPSCQAPPLLNLMSCGICVLRGPCGNLSLSCIMHYQVDVHEF